MPFTYQLVCLANSIKHHPSRCIAGRIVSNNALGNWIRPVGDHAINEGAISPSQSILQGGTQPEPLDILEVSFDSHSPHGCQTENYLINKSLWRKVGRIDWTNLQTMVEAHDDLWGSGDSSNKGINDRINLASAARLTDSLRLIRPNNFRIIVDRPGEAFNDHKKQMRGHFSIGGIQYSLKITDPNYTNNINNYELNTEYPVHNCIICASIGDVFNGNHYKLIATIFEENQH